MITFHWICVFIFVFAIEFVANSSGREIQNNTRILFIGQSHVFFGHALPFGFISLIKSEISSRYSNVTISYIGGREASIEDLNVMLTDYLNINEKPHVAIIMAGYNDIIGGKSTSWNIRINILHLISKIFEVGSGSIDIAICTPINFGDKIDGSNIFEEELEELGGIIKSIGILTESSTSIIDIRMQMLKQAERFNVDNLSHSILTFDSYHLNELGHKVLANGVLQYLEGGISNPYDIRLRYPDLPIKRRKYPKAFTEDGELIEDEDIDFETKEEL